MDAQTQPWIEKPHRLISWGDMNQFSALEFYKLGQALHILREVLGKYQKDNPEASVTKVDEEFFFKQYGEALELANQVGLKITAKWIIDAQKFAKEGAKFDAIGNYVWPIMETIKKEMEEQLFLYVPASRSAFYEKDAAAFLSDKCRDRFPSVLPEIDEAMKCYAVGRYTACAFHLMRATEAGTKSLGDAIGAKVRNNNWGDVFKEYDKQLSAAPAARPDAWGSHGEFLENIGANLRAVKTLRNSIAHLDDSYTEERAEKLMVLVPEFLRQLAEKMDESGKLL